MDAEEVPHCAPTVIAFAAVVSTVTADGAVAGSGICAVAVADVGFWKMPCVHAVPVDPLVRMTTVTSARHCQFVAPVVVVKAFVAANATPATPP